MASFVTIPAVSLFPLPEEISTVDASVLEPLGVALHALERCIFKPGDDVAILGPGPIGLLAAGLLRQAGASNIIVAGLADDTQRLAFAKKWGGTVVNASQEDLGERVRELTDGRGVDLTFEMSGGKGALNTAVGITKSGGQVAVVGLGSPDVFDFNQMVHKEIELVGSWRRQPSSWYRAINLVKAGRLPAGEVVTHQFAIAEAEQGFRLLLDRQAIKVLIVPED
jgi:L-iditol 2-dehydrogenase